MNVLKSVFIHMSCVNCCSFWTAVKDLLPRLWISIQNLIQRCVIWFGVKHRKASKMSFCQSYIHRVKKNLHNVTVNAFCVNCPILV